jgi:hypothetical protein
MRPKVLVLAKDASPDLFLCASSYEGPGRMQGLSLSLSLSAGRARTGLLRRI